MQQRKGFQWDNISFNNWIGLSSQLFNPDFLPGVPLTELWLFQTFSFVAWKNRDWIVEASKSWLTHGLRGRMSYGSIVRGKKALCKRGLLQLHNMDYDDGNYYLVNPILLSKKERPELAHWQEASWLMETFELSAKLDLNDPGQTEMSADPDLPDPGHGSARSTSENFSRLNLDRCDPHSIDHRNTIEDLAAPRHSPITSQGGEPVRNIRSPHGQDHIGGEDKGVGLSADVLRKGLSQVHAHLDSIGAVRAPRSNRLVEA